MNSTENINSICRDIFKAIHEGKWLSIEYRNKNSQVTKYWIGIKDINPLKRSLKVEGLHLSQYTVDDFDCIYIDSIISTNIIEGSYCRRNEKMLQDIYYYPEKYKSLFCNVANLKILNYLEECNRMDAIPYKNEYALIDCLDRERLEGEYYQLNDVQFKQIVDNFQYKASKSTKLRVQQLAINVLSVSTTKGLYVLAYRKIELDVRRKVLIPEKEITICTEFTIDGSKESIRKFLDADDYELLADFEHNAEAIKDAIQKQNNVVDDMPYFIGIGFDVVLDLRKEYKAITDMYNKNDVSVPVKAFFGQLVKRPNRRKDYPVVLVDKKVNIDQLLAINNAMKYPLAYIQGPPGTGKTSTIINTITTAFFNKKTVLFTSYNNHPIDGVVDKLTNLRYKDMRIPFPILRLGNNDVNRETINYLKDIIERTKSIKIFDKTLDKNRDDRIERTRALSEILKKYEELLTLKERHETIKTVQDSSEAADAMSMDISFEISLTNQANNIQEDIDKIGRIEEDEVLSLIEGGGEDLFKYLYYTSAKYIQGVTGKCGELIDILEMTDEEKRLGEFNRYISETENIKKLLKAFPVVATTCISAHKIGAPEPYFDMVIMDEASQCNTATALVPIIRGESLMLVGDPQQLNPVILLDEAVNSQLKKKYSVADEYDYCKNSIYKTYLSCDAVSDEILLRNHYRCNKKIIDFNNKKYYNGKLNIKSLSEEKQPLVFVDTGDVDAYEKNTSNAEADSIIKYCKMHSDKSIGIITPFVKQCKLIEQMLKENSLENVTCGTVHAFQGDEKEVVLFSTAITNNTNSGTYEWLKNNKELINVATSRAREKLILFASAKNVERLHHGDSQDDFHELIQYVKTNGQSKITQKTAMSRALGVKPFTTEMEEAFLQNLRHALSNILIARNKYEIQKEVSIAHVFSENIAREDLFYSGRFDFVVYQVANKTKLPVLVIELDGKEHYEKEVVMARDKKKKAICEAHNMQMLRVENAYARRYNYIKDILIKYFSGK